MKYSILLENLNFGSNVEKLHSLIHEQYCKTVFLFAYSQIQSVHFAEEITQNTFIKVFTKVDAEHLYKMSIETKENGKTGLALFIFKIAKRCIIDFTRSKDYQCQSQQVLLEPHHEKSIEAKYDHHFSDEMVAAFNQLPSLWEQVIKLYILEGCSHKEIAQDLSITEGHSKNCLSKAKNKLRQLLTINKDGTIPK